MQLLPLQQSGWKAAGAKQQPLPFPCPPLPRTAPICLLPRTSTSAHTPACSANTSGSSTFSSSSSTGLNHPQQRRAQRGRRLRAAAEGTEAAGPASTKLADLQASPLVNEQGLVNPSVPGGDIADFKAFVFAIYDAQLKIQYTGFSTDLRNTLRTLIGRRPDKAFYYKVVGLPELDQAKMVDLRNAWYEQLGGAPIGNKLQLERNMWQQPVDAGAISARGKRGAAEECARQLQEQLKLLGCTEEFTPNPTLMDDGLVDFLPVAGISQDTSNALKDAQQEAKKRTRKAKATIDGQDQLFDVRYDVILKTNGGYMLDVAVTLDNRTTTHRVVVGSHYVEGQGLASPEAAVESAFAALLEAKLPRQTEGLMSMGMFPTNYFSVAGADQWFPEEFARAFEYNAARPLKADTDKAWRFTRTRSYGAAFVDEQAKSDKAEADEQARADREADEAEARRLEEEAEADYTNAL